MTKFATCAPYNVSEGTGSELWMTAISFRRNTYQKGDEMHYELYLDSLFLLNFGMNLILLSMVDHSTCHTATWYRLLCGAGLGAGSYLLPFLWKGSATVKVLSCFLPGTVLMLYVSFGIRSLKMLWYYSRKLMLDTCLLGGILVAVVRSFPACVKYLTCVVPLLGLGSLFALLIVKGREKEVTQKTYCNVVLQGETESIRVRAIVDSGNTLTEPISRAPVSVIDAQVFHRLWPEGLPGMRVIPYHSVGKKSGILYGYPIPQIVIARQGVEKVCKQVWLAVSEEEVGGETFVMLLHPSLWERSEEYKGGSKQKAGPQEKFHRGKVADRSRQI